MKKFLLCVLSIMLYVSAACGGATEDLLKAVVNENTTPEQIVKLINSGANVNANDNNGSTALILAACNNSNPDVIAELIKAGADVNAKNKGFPNGTALYWTIFNPYKKPDIEVVRVLLNAGADVNNKDGFGTSILITAVAYSQNPEIIKLLLDFGADINLKDTSNNYTALMAAAAHESNPEVIRLLLNAGADINDKDIWGMNAFIHAVAQNRNPEVIKLLLNAGSNVNVKNKKGQSAKDIAKLNKNPKIQKMAEIFDYFGNFETVLLNATKENAKPEAISTIIDLGVNINAKNQNGATALMMAAANTSYPEVINILANAGIDVNAKTKDGQTALIYAARFNKNPEVVKTLIKIGADVKAKDSFFFGKTAKDWAIQSNASQEIIKILEEL